MSYLLYGEMLMSCVVICWGVKQVGSVREASGADESGRWPREGYAVGAERHCCVPPLKLMLVVEIVIVSSFSERDGKVDELETWKLDNVDKDTPQSGSEAKGSLRCFTDHR